NQVTAARSRAGRTAIVSRVGGIAVEDLKGKNKRLLVVAPAAHSVGPGGSGAGAIRDAATDAAAVVALPVAQIRYAARRGAAQRTCAVHGHVRAGFGKGD